MSLESAAVALARWPALTAAGLVLLAVVGVSGAARLEVAVDVAKLWAQTVGSEEIPRRVFVAAEIDPWGDASDQARVDALVADLAAVQGVAGASTPRTPTRLGALDPAERDAAARALLGPIRGVAVQVDLEPGDRALDGVAEVVGALEAPAALVGAPVLDRALTEAARRDQPRVIGLLLALFAVTLWGIFRHPWGVVLPLTAVGLNVLAVAGLMGWAGVPLGGATMLLLPMLLVFGIEETVHVVRHYEEEVAQRLPEEALERALAAVARPCALTNATTAVGFLALIASSSPAVRTFGLLGGLGMAIALFTALAVPAVAFRVSRARPTRTALVVGLEAGLDRAFTWVGQRPRGAWSALGVVLVLLAVGASQARTDLGVVDDLPDGHALHSDQAWADALLGGVHPLELTLRFPDGIADLEAWRAALELRRTLAADPAVGAVTSIAEIVLALGRTMDTTPDRLAQKAFAPGPRAKPLRVELVRLASEASRTPLLDLDRGTFTFVVRVHEGRAAGWSALLERVRELDERLPDATIEARGWVPLAVAAWRRIPWDAARVILSACVALLFALYLADRSPRTAARAILPLVVSLVAVLACLAVVGVPLSYPNLFVLSAVLGVGVDAQIHLVGHYRRHGSVRRAFVTAGASCLSSQLVITAGLLGVVASSVSSVRWAAVVLSIGMATHLFAALAVFALRAREP